jgi:hypothetical protein
MEKFSIDLKASKKGERKKVVKYLRDKGYTVIKRKGETISFLNYLCYGVSYPTSDNDFEYNNSCVMGELITLPQDWDKLVKIIEEEKPLKEFVVGRWYACDVLFARYSGDNTGIGWAFNDWSVGVSMANPPQWKLATPEEIKEALVKEAKKRGFVNGVEYKHIHNSYNCKVQDAGGFVYSSKDFLTDGHGGSVYIEGQWAEILKEEVPVIGGYKLEDKGCYWSFGCFKFDRELTRKIFSILKNNGIDHLSIKGTKVTLKDVEKVIKYIDGQKKN